MLASSSSTVAALNAVRSHKHFNYPLTLLHYRHTRYDGSVFAVSITLILVTIIVPSLAQYVLELVTTTLTEPALAAMTTSSLSVLCSRLDTWLTHCAAAPPSSPLAPVRSYVHRTALARGLQLLDQASNDNDGHTRAGALIGLAASFCPRGGPIAEGSESDSDDGRNGERALLPYIQRLVCEELAKVTTIV